MTPPADLPRRLGLLDSIAIVIGTVIGVGIFLVPASIARELPSLPLMIVVWIGGGIISFFGALAYAELGSMFPHSGGQYVYLREAYGPLPAFLCGWSFFLIINSGSIATVSVGMAIYLSYLLPNVPGLTRWAPALLIAILTAVNYRGVRWGAGVQNTFTILKVAGLLVLIGSALASPAPAAWDWSLHPEAFTTKGVVLGLLGCFVAYDGWHYIAFIAGEVKDPRRNLLWSLIIGVSAVAVLYVLAVLAYSRILPLAVLASSNRPAATTAAQVLGPLGAILVTLTIVISSSGAANGAIMTSPRVYFAQARDGLFFKRMGEIHPRFEAPSFAVLIHGLWTMLLTLTNSYETLFTYTMFISWAIHGMCAAAVLVLRFTRPDAPRPYRMWGYPVAPLLFVAFTAWFMINTFLQRPKESLAGLALIAAGLPVYWYWSRRSHRAA